MEAIGCIVFALYGLIQLVAAAQGFEHYFGWLGAVLAFGFCIYFRFTLPFTIAAFLCAKNLWHWHWIWALLFAAPGLLLVVPALLASFLDLMSAQSGRQPPARVTTVVPGSKLAASEEHRAASTDRTLWLALAGMGALVVGALVLNAPQRPPINALSTAPEVTDEPISEVSPASPPAPALADVSPLRTARIEEAAREFDRVLQRSGIIGARAYSEGCHNRLATTRALDDFDFCAAFDLSAHFLDSGMAEVAGIVPQPYFQRVTTDENLMASIGLASSDVALGRDRIQQLRARVPSIIDRVIRARIERNRAEESFDDNQPDDANLPQNEVD